ncbi:unnamed protein product [Auanema sp. JU1783]|nr:unnamed protein product [Auanema sp. JU1783]
MMNLEETKRKSKPPLNSIFYTELLFILIGVLLGGFGLLQPHISLLLWLPCLLILCSSCGSLSALIYLNKGVAWRSSQSLLRFMLLTLLMVLFRIVCSCILIVGNFFPHSKPIISLTLAGVTFLHALYGLYAISKTTTHRTGIDKRINIKDTRKSNQIEEIAVISLGNSQLLSSQTTLFTTLDEAELVNYVT